MVPTWRHTVQRAPSAGAELERRPAGRRPRKGSLRAVPRICVKRTSRVHLA